MKDAKGHGSDARGGASTVRLDTADSPARKTGYLATPQPKYGANPNAARTAEGGRLSTAAAERIAMRQATDARRADLAPPMTITDRAAAMTLGQGHPKSDVVPLGSSFAAAKAALERGRSVALPPGAENRRKS
jgi:hypothetical protein